MADQSNNGKTPPRRPPQPLAAVVTKTPPISVHHHLQHLQPLVPSRVRWFYQEERKWIAFCGADSLRIEGVFKSLPPEFQSSLLIPSNFDPSKVAYPTVKGSLYEVDILGRECRPIYWKENAVPIMRGTWFKGSIPGNWEPIEEKDAQIIEDAHIKVVRSLGLGSPLDSQNHSSPANSNAIHTMKIGVHRIEWHDISDVYMISESAGSRLAQKIGLSGATELHRGYEEDCDITDELPPINHIVFLVHGMGQLYHGEGGIVHSRKKLTDVVQKANSRFFKEKCSKGLDGRVEFFPIEWRTKLKLDEGMIEKITPSNLGSLRKVINDTTLDVFYYTSPFYREEIIQAMRKELNHVYESYQVNNPGFIEKGGKVSIIAHSLGSVIIHDVLTLWNSNLMKEHQQDADVRVASASNERLFSWFLGWGQEKGEKAPSSLSLCSEDELKAHLHDARMKIAKIELKTGANANQSCGETSKNTNIDCYSLEFKVENVFNIGSPLGMFLVMRGIRPRNDIEQHILPTSVCKKTFNIYDPTDPVAYRLEPLIYDYYADIPPVRLSQIGMKQKSTSNISGKGASGWLKGFFSSKSNKTEDPIIFKNEEGEVDLPKSEDEKTQEILEGKKVMDNRLDFVLEQSMVEYFSAITSHQAYWHTLDFARFVLYNLYEVGEKESVEPNPASSNEGSSQS